MNVVIDAQLVNYYHRELFGKASPCTGKAGALFEGLGEDDIAFADDGQRIEAEWRAVVDIDWFRDWYGDLLLRGGVVEVPVKKKADLLKRLETTCGFPKADGIYVSTAMTVVEGIKSEVALVSEDLDFYDPKAKGCEPGRRKKILETSGGPVSRELRKVGIRVAPVVHHCAGRAT